MYDERITGLMQLAFQMGVAAVVIITVGAVVARNAIWAYFYVCDGIHEGLMREQDEVEK